MNVYENLDINNLDGEIWKNIEDYPDYQVSNCGRIKSLKFGKEIIRKQQKRGEYLQVNISKDGEYNSKRVHILVFETHNNYKLKSNEDVHHINEDKENNNYENLRSIPKSKHLSFTKEEKIIHYLENTTQKSRKRK